MHYLMCRTAVLNELVQCLMFDSKFIILLGYLVSNSWIICEWLIRRDKEENKCGLFWGNIFELSCRNWEKPQNTSGYPASWSVTESSFTQIWSWKWWPCWLFCRCEWGCWSCEQGAPGQCWCTLCCCLTPDGFWWDITVSIAKKWG